MPDSGASATRLDLGVETIVHIFVLRKGHDPDEEPKLEVYPHGEFYAIVYHRDHPHVVRPTRPAQVRWIVHGLRAGELLTVESEAKGDPLFQQDEYPMDSENNSIASGLARRHEAKDIAWRYKLHWQNGRGKRIEYPSRRSVYLDPIVIIKEDP